MPRVAFTGTTNVPDRKAAVDLIQRALDEAGLVTGVTTGAANGVDTLALLVALGRFPTIDHHVIAPGAPHNESVLATIQAWPSGRVTRLPPNPDKARAYRFRNEMMVAEADLLLAFPPTPVEHQGRGPGGGTWMTVRMARRAGVPVCVYALNGDSDGA